MITQIPEPRKHLTFYYGRYSNIVRGQRLKSQPKSQAPDQTDTHPAEEPTLSQHATPHCDGGARTQVRGQSSLRRSWVADVKVPIISVASGRATIRKRPDRAPPLLFGHFDEDDEGAVSGVKLISVS